jgi:hypothetical protein
VLWDFALAPGAPSGQYAALRLPAGDRLSESDRVLLHVRADREVRAWVQLRSQRGARWGRSFYAGLAPRRVELLFRDFIPLGEGAASEPELAQVDALLLVVDTVNTRPGTAGQLGIAEVWLAR